ncbi:MAG: C10 family peptidase [Bacteroidales bacterium]|nr:C10 family peptidase [Bacteroidales bacterium]
MRYIRFIKNGIGLLIILMLAGKTTAQQISQKEVVNAAINSLIRKYPEKVESFSETSLSSVYSLNDNGNCLIYEVCFKNGTRVILSGNKSCLPILGYLDFCNIDSTHIESVLSFGDDIPDGLKLLLSDYAEQNRYCFDNHIEDEGNQLYWDNLQRKIENREMTVVNIPPLITTQWGQSRSNDITPSNIDYYAYNYFVPNGTNCSQHCYAGCGAVAMAQIMKYWNEPKDIPSKCTQFDWNNMPNELIQQNNNNYTYQRNAVAKLMYDCGMEIEMHYCSDPNSPCSSGNYIYNTITGFDTFGYTMGTLLSRGLDDDYWINLILQELYNDRPIYYAARTSEGIGHAFICDGYIKDESDNHYFHFNWGWNGRYDGYYSISNLSPSQYSFNYGHRMICNIYPTGCWEKILMECNKVFSNGTVKGYTTSGKFDNNTHDYIINNGANVFLQAGEEVYLSNGFYAEEGSEFIAYLAPCGNSVSMGEGRTRGENLPEVMDERLQRNIENMNQTAFSISPMDMAIYPNPVTGTFSIRLGNLSEKIEFVEVFNVIGGMALRCDNAQEGIDASILHKGVYIVRVRCSSGNVYYDKFVKE